MSHRPPEQLLTHTEQPKFRLFSQCFTLVIFLVHSLIFQGNETYKKPRLFRQVSKARSSYYAAWGIETKVGILACYSSSVSLLLFSRIWDLD